MICKVFVLPPQRVSKELTLPRFSSGIIILKLYFNSKLIQRNLYLGYNFSRLLLFIISKHAYTIQINKADEKLFLSFPNSLSK
jgi:hypothetical protein